MKGKTIFGAAFAAGIAMTGCMSGMYSSDVSVSKRKDGIKNYEIVKSLDVKVYPATMPVVVDYKSSTEIGDHSLSFLLWFFSLGIVPAFESQATTYDVTVKTPLGEKSGTCSVEACSWWGWLPIFLPYPGIADERTPRPKLPNTALETNTREKLVANLVSQFSKEDYDRLVAQYNSPDAVAKREAERELAQRKAEYDRWLSSDDKEDGVTLEAFEQKYKEGWAARAEQKKQARLAKEVAEREEARRQAELAERLRKRNEVRDAIVAADLAAIRKTYERSEKYTNPFLGGRNRNSEDWLKTWTGSRLDLSEADKLAGEALLSEFGTKYLPNAYANYEKAKDVAIELQQVFNEEFDRPWTIKTTSPKWNSFNKVLDKFAEARTGYFMCHDELCHYWLAWRLGALTETELANIDTKKLAVHLLPENIERSEYTLLKYKAMEGKVADFAARYAPESSAVYQKLEHEFKELDALLKELFKQHIQLDDVRFDRTLAAAVAKRNDLVRELNTLSLDLQTWDMDHRTTVKSSEDVAKCDHELAMQLKPFVEALPAYIKEKSQGRVIPSADMIEVGKILPAPSVDSFSEEEILACVPEERRERALEIKRTDSSRYDGILEKFKREIKNGELENVYRGVRGLSIQRTEVTQMQWMIVMGNNPSGFKGPDRPVENVSWNDCQEFIAKVSSMDGVQYRLPKEVEWEYACRAGSKSDWGKRRNGEDGPLETMGWYDGNSGSKTHAVALKEPNAWGLFDMHGNVWEWCEGERGSSDRVSRGGGWSYDARYCTASYRGNYRPDNRYYNLGFRLAASQD